MNHRPGEARLEFPVDDVADFRPPDIGDAVLDQGCLSRICLRHHGASVARRMGAGSGGVVISECNARLWASLLRHDVGVARGHSTDDLRSKETGQELSFRVNHRCDEAPADSRNANPSHRRLHHPPGPARSVDPRGIEVFTAAAGSFRSVLKSENHTLKRALIDPRVVSGIGNRPTLARRPVQSICRRARSGRRWVLGGGE
jgi:hypothetical protein